MLPRDPLRRPNLPLPPVIKKSAKQPNELKSYNSTSATRVIIGRLRFLGLKRRWRHTSGIIVVLVTNPAESSRPHLRLTVISYVRRQYKRSVDTSRKSATTRVRTSLDPSRRPENPFDPTIPSSPG